MKNIKPWEDMYRAMTDLISINRDPDDRLTQALIDYSFAKERITDKKGKEIVAKIDSHINTKLEDKKRGIYGRNVFGMTKSTRQNIANLLFELYNHVVETY